VVPAGSQLQRAADVVRHVGASQSKHAISHHFKRQMYIAETLAKNLSHVKVKVKANQTEKPNPV